MLSITNWKILAVDDEPDNLSLLNDILSFFQVSITPCDSGADALEALEQNEFDLVLLDIQMPQMSGWDVIQAIRQHPNPEISNMLVVAVTALVLPRDRDRMIEAGFNGVILKPIEVENFMLALQEITQREDAKSRGDSKSK
jgi:CheY-like chemotaxis protein